MSDYIRTINGKKIVGLLTRLHVANLQETEIKTNGEYTPEEGYDGFSKVTVDLPLEEKIFTKNGVYKPESPTVGFDKVTVSLPIEEKNITANGVYEPTSPNVGFSKITVSVPEAKVIKNIKVEFPGMEIQESDISKITESLQNGLSPTRYVCNKTSSVNTYSGYKLVTSCRIDYNGTDLFMPSGEVEDTDTELSSETAGVATIKRWAKFVDGVLTTWTTYSVNSTKPVATGSIDSISNCTATMTIT